MAPEKAHIFPSGVPVEILYDKILEPVSDLIDIVRLILPFIIRKIFPLPVPDHESHGKEIPDVNGSRQLHPSDPDRSDDRIQLDPAL